MLKLVDLLMPVVYVCIYRIDILVNNASVQHYRTTITDITSDQLQETFSTNVFGYFYMVQVLPMNKCVVSCIITYM
jgi:NAD(P)-dependent dehydrogenase (short-subunit alcohol dehydrogenase family)